MPWPQPESNPCEVHWLKILMSSCSNLGSSFPVHCSMRHQPYSVSWEYTRDETQFFVYGDILFDYKLSWSQWDYRSGMNSGDDTIVHATKPFRGNLSSHTLKEWSAWGLRGRSVNFQIIWYRKSPTSEFNGVLSGLTHVEDVSFKSLGVP